MPRTAVVILNWNGASFLEKFLPSVVAHSPNAEVIVADNGSTDRSKEISIAANAKWLDLESNHGFAKGYNIALNKLDHEYFVLLNSDVEVTEGWLDDLESYFDQDEKLAAYQPKILDYNNKEWFEYAGASGGFLDIYGFAFCRGRIFDSIEVDEGQYDHRRSIMWATGACMMVRASAFRKVGGFDQDYFAHFEEIDLCWRLKNAGLDIQVIPTSKVYHVGGGTLAAEKPRKTYLNFRNSLLMLHKNLPRKKRFGRLYVRLTLDGLAAASFLFTRGPAHAIAILHAHVSFYTSIISNRKKRTGSESDQHPELLKMSLVRLWKMKGFKKFSSIKVLG